MTKQAGDESEIWEKPRKNMSVGSYVGLYHIVAFCNQIMILTEI